jgi:hypothetical protein
MALGEKIAEEKGKITGMSIKSVGPEGITIELNIMSEVKGHGRTPNGRNIGTLTLIEGPKTSPSTGQGIFVTEDGETLPWHVNGVGKIIGGKRRAISLATFSTSSQKYAWVNDGIYVLDAEFSADLSQFSDTSYEWK